jgi:hypothetical protein
MDAAYQARRHQIEQHFIPANLLSDEREPSLSPSGRYRLDLSLYRTGETAWTYSKGTVTDLTSQIVVADIKRNHPAFWHGWIVHPNGREYLLCGEDSQGYTVIDLTARQIHTFLPEAAYSGHGFCWAAVYPSPDKLLLAVEGCYWAAPYDIVFFDFAEPSRLPLPELGRITDLDVTIGWDDNDTFALSREYIFRTSDGARYEDLSAQEREAVDADNTLRGYAKETVRWRRSVA